MAEQFSIRLANKNDIKSVFELSNDDVVRRNSINTDKIEWNSHVNWFEKRIQDFKNPFYIVESNEGEFIGQVRFDKKDDEVVISISISPNYRGKSLSSRIIKECTK